MAGIQNRILVQVSLYFVSCFSAVSVRLVCVFSVSGVRACVSSCIVSVSESFWYGFGMVEVLCIIFIFTAVLPVLHCQSHSRRRLCAKYRIASENQSNGYLKQLWCCSVRLRIVGVRILAVLILFWVGVPSSSSACCVLQFESIAWLKAQCSSNGHPLSLLEFERSSSYSFRCIVSSD